MNLGTCPNVGVSLGETLDFALLPMGLAASCMATGSHWFVGERVSGASKRLWGAVEVQHGVGCNCSPFSLFTIRVVLYNVAMLRALESEIFFLFFFQELSASELLYHVFIIWKGCLVHSVLAVKRLWEKTETELRHHCDFGIPITFTSKESLHWGAHALCVSACTRRHTHTEDRSQRAVFTIFLFD